MSKFTKSTLSLKQVIRRKGWFENNSLALMLVDFIRSLCSVKKCWSYTVIFSATLNVYQKNPAAKIWSNGPDPIFERICITPMNSPSKCYYNMVNVPWTSLKRVSTWVASLQVQRRQNRIVKLNQIVKILRRLLTNCYFLCLLYS